MTTANTNARAIDALREEIDTLDQELLALMEKRLDLAAAIGSSKATVLETLALVDGLALCDAQVVLALGARDRDRAAIDLPAQLPPQRRARRAAADPTAATSTTMVMRTAPTASETSAAARRAARCLCGYQ